MILETSVIIISKKGILKLILLYPLMQQYGLKGLVLVQVEVFRLVMTLTTEKTHFPIVKAEFMQQLIHRLVLQKIISVIL